MKKLLFFLSIFTILISQNLFAQCVPASNLNATAYSTSRSEMYVGWTSGNGALLSLFINGTAYADASNGQTLFSPAWFGMWVRCDKVAGGLVPGKIYQLYVREYTSLTDPLNNTYCDSPKLLYTVPSGVAYPCSTPAVIAVPSKKGNK